MEQRELYYEIYNELHMLIDRCELPSIQTKSKTIERINEIIKQCKSKIPCLYRYSPLDANNIINALNNGTVYLSEASGMNDIFEGAPADRNNKEPIQKIREFQSGFFLKCFSEDPCNILMWSHYGDSNKGIAIGYDFKRATEGILKHLYPVFYSKNRFVSKDIDQLLSNPYFFIKKSTEWQYEKEWRLIYSGSELKKSASFYKELDCIREIVFGSRVDHETIQAIKTAFMRKENISFSQISIDNQSFTLSKNVI